VHNKMSTNICCVRRFLYILISTNWNRPEDVFNSMNWNRLNNVFNSKKWNWMQDVFKSINWKRVKNLFKTTVWINFAVQCLEVIFCFYGPKVYSSVYRISPLDHNLSRLRSFFTFIHTISKIHFNIMPRLPRWCLWWGFQTYLSHPSHPFFKLIILAIPDS
jgi:hypothetical protein